MKAQTKKAITGLGGAAALVLTVGVSAVGFGPAGSAATTQARPSSGVAAASPAPITPGSGTGVHNATLSGCIIGLDPC